MQDPAAHYRIVYTGRDGQRIVSMTRMTLDHANSLAALVDGRARHGRFTVEDETGDERERAAA